jgi:hypothetical protein
MLAQLRKVVALHAFFAALAAAWIFWTGAGSLASLAVLWLGAFLTWLTARSHVSSSILLRMVHLLRDGPLSRADLLARYHAAHGASHRSEELARTGLLRDSTPTLAGRVLGALALRMARSAPSRTPDSARKSPADDR